MNRDVMNLPDVFITENTQETEDIGKMIAALIVDTAQLPRFVAMYGDLGVGKTSFVRGFCSELSTSSNVKSPTFALVNEYKCTKNAGNIKKIYHFDMYRIVDEDDLYSIGFYDYLNSSAICIAEWCEMIPYALPDNYIRVEIKKLDFGDKRSISVNLIGV